MFGGLKSWMERVLERPFYVAEIIRVEIIKENKTMPLKFPKNLLLKLKEIHH